MQWVNVSTGTAVPVIVQVARGGLPVIELSPSSKPEYTWPFPQNAQLISISDNYSCFTINKKDNTQEDTVRVNVIAGTESKVLEQDIHVPGLTQVQGYDYVFPDNLAYYTAGTIVLQLKDNRMYQCRPYPYSSYCYQ